MRKNDSSLSNSATVEVQNVNTIKTDPSKTDSNKKEREKIKSASTHLDEKKSPIPTKRERVDSLSQEKEMKKSLETAFYRGKDEVMNLLSAYQNNKGLLKQLVIEISTEQNKRSYFSEDYQKAYEKSLVIYQTALTELLHTKGTLSHTDKKITRQQLMETICKMLHNHGRGYVDINLGFWTSTAIAEFMEAEEKTKIRNPVAFMKYCITSKILDA